MSLSTKIHVGLVLGIVTGLFLGELAAPLSPIGIGFIRLLQMSVLPYVAVSLIALFAAALFSAVHHIGPLGDAFELNVFVYRFLAGLAFTAIYYYNNLKAAEDDSVTLIENPDRIEVGWTIYLPSAEEDAAY